MSHVACHVLCQACLDHTFKGQRASCLVNPRAGYETELHLPPTTHKKRLAVVGAGPAGLAFATAARERGHEVTLYDGEAQIGGQVRVVAERRDRKNRETTDRRV